jgi:hypothetical protein
MSISGISGQANSNIQVSIRLSQGRAAGAGGNCYACNDGDGDDGGASAGSSAAGAQGTSAFASLAQQIQSAVESAVKNLDPSESNNPLDVIKTILEAIDKALKDNAQGGSGTTDASQTASDGTPAVNPTEQTSTTAAGDGADSTSPSSSDSAALPTSPADTASPTGPKSLLDSLLSQFGIDPQQFKSDLLSALGGSQNGNVDFSIVFKNFPVGQAINAQA